jgi:hypothetical protein
VQHPFENPDRTVGAEDPEYIEPAQRIDRYDAIGLNGERHFCISHGAPIAVANGLTGRKRASVKMVAKN